MLAGEREQLILNYLMEHEVATSGFLSELTGASIATVRRDLNSMNKRGLIVKTHGGAQKLKKDSLAERINDTLNPDANLGKKESLAKIAAGIVETGDIIFVGAGMTCNLLARYIKDKKNITLVTTNLTAVLELIKSPNISLILLGGDIHIGSNHIETLDEYTVDALNKLYFGKVFFTVDGIDLENGCSIINRAQLPLYNHLLNNSEKLYLLADSSKFNKRTFTKLCDIDIFKNIITNSDTDPKYFEYFKQNGINCYTD